MNTKSLLVLLTTFVLMVISGCQPAPSTTDSLQTDLETGNNEVQNIQVDKVSPQKIPGAIEEFPLPNCGGTGKLTQSLGTQVSISKSVQMGTTVSVSGGGEVGVSAVAKLSLEAAVEAAYKQEYETANSRLDTIGMEAAPKTHVIYTIEWEKQDFTSVVTFEFNREMVQTPYTFTMNVPKIAGSREKQCPDIGSVMPVNPPASGVVLFSDDFSSNKNNWITGKFNSKYIEQDRNITDGRLQFIADFKTNSFGWTNVPNLREKNFYLTIDAEIYQSSPNSKIGVTIVFRHLLQDEIAYIVIFNSDSSFKFVRMTEYNYEIVHDEKSNAFDLRDGKTNKFDIRAEEQKFTVYANGVELYTLVDNSIKSVGEIGLGVNGEAGNFAVVRFDNVAIMEVP